MHDRDASFLGIAYIGESQRFAAGADLTAVRAVRINTTQHFHQCRFACAVFADQRMHFTSAQVERHVIESADAGEALGDLFHLQESPAGAGLCGHGFSVYPERSEGSDGAITTSARSDPSLRSG